MKKEINKYLKQVMYFIPLPYKQKKEYTKLLENKILELEALYGTITYNDIVEKFGNPKDVASDFLSEMDTETLITRIKFSSFIKKMIIIILALASFVTVWICTLAYMDYKKAEEQIITEIEYTLPEELSNEKISD